VVTFFLLRLQTFFLFLSRFYFYLNVFYMYGPNRIWISSAISVQLTSMPKWPTQTHTQCYVRRTNSVFSYLRTLTTWHCPHSPATAPAVQQSIDISCWLGPQHQSCSSGFVAVGPRDPSTGIDRWRERRTFNRPRSAYSSSSSDNGADSIPSNIAYVGTMRVKKVKVDHTRLPSCHGHVQL